MITASFEDYMLKVSGHAMFAEPGNDIVCAAASILAYTLAESVQRLQDSGNVDWHMLKVDKGELVLTAGPGQADEARLRCRAAYDTIRAGYELLAEKYPGYIRVKH